MRRILATTVLVWGMVPALALGAEDPVGCVAGSGVYLVADSRLAVANGTPTVLAQELNWEVARSVTNGVLDCDTLVGAFSAYVGVGWPYGWTETVGESTVIVTVGRPMPTTTSSSTTSSSTTSRPPASTSTTSSTTSTTLSVSTTSGSGVATTTVSSATTTTVGIPTLPRSEPGDSPDPSGLPNAPDGLGSPTGPPDIPTGDVTVETYHLDPMSPVGSGAERLGVPSSATRTVLVVGVLVAVVLLVVLVGWFAPRWDARRYDREKATR